MDTDHWRRARTIFARSLEVDEDRRDAFISDQCRNQENLEHAVRRLIESDVDESGFLEAPLAEIEYDRRRDRFEQRWIGETLGSHRLLEVVGRGGMSTVYRAERADGHFEQIVVVKFIQWGRNTPEFRERLRAERRILATLEHPNIARLIDGGETDDGDPYLVMEYVEGVSIDDYCNNNDLELPERVELFREVCDALDYAHRRLVIHRDLKPANILVTSDGQPKLLDFGIAKLINEGSESDLTAPAMRVLTPNYASPEQILGEPVTTASDIFSAGVLLYELVAGRRPFDWRGRSTAEVREALESETVVVPSEAAATTDGTRAKSIRGDLDNIILKALRREPEARYGSVERFSDDLSRFLGGRPVQARPQTWSYRARRLLARNRVASAIAAILLITVLAYAGTATFQARRLQQQRNDLIVQRDRAEATLSFLKEILQAPDPALALGAEVTLRSVIDEKTAEVLEMDHQPDIKAELLIVLGETYRNLGLQERAITLLRESVQLQRNVQGVDSLEAAAAHKALAEALEERGEIHEAIEEINIALKIERLKLPAGAAAIGDSLYLRGELLDQLGDFTQAKEDLAQALVIHRRSFGEMNDDVANDLHVLGLIAWDLERPEAALEHLRHALAIRRQIYGDRHPKIAESLNDLGLLASEQRQFNGAEELLQSALAAERLLYGEVHPEIVTTLLNLAHLREDRRDFEGARVMFDEALAINDRLPGGDPEAASSLMSGLGHLELEMGEPQKAETAFRQVLSYQLDALGSEAPTVAGSRISLASALHGQGKYAEAEQEFRAAQAVLELIPEHDYLLAMATRGLAANLQAQGEFAQAEVRFVAAVDGLLKTLGESHPITSKTQAYRAWNLFEGGNREEAGTLFDQSFKLQLESESPDSVDIAMIQVRFSDYLLAEGDAQRALKLASEARRTLLEQLGPGHWKTGLSVAVEAGARSAVGDFETAITVLGSGRSIKGLGHGSRKRLVLRCIQPLIDSPTTTVSRGASRWLKQQRIFTVDS